MINTHTKNLHFNQFPIIIKRIFQIIDHHPHAQFEKKYTLRASVSDHPVNISSVAFSEYKAKNIFQ